MTPKTNTTLHKAAPMVGKETPDLDLCAETHVPDGMTIEEAARFFDREAMLVVDALTASLPGGTIDRVLAELLRRKASGYIIVDERMQRR